MIELQSTIPTTIDIEPVTNALAVIITIGDYNQDSSKRSDNMERTSSKDIEYKNDDESEPLTLQNIPIDKDVDNLSQLFKLLNYDILPKDHRSHWSQKELVDFLTEIRGKKLYDEDMEKAKYDGLIVCISSHGTENHIITSDLKAIQKDAIHRIFSANFPKIRGIPRIFLFDSCDAPMTREILKQNGNDLDEVGIYFGLNDLSIENQWTDTDKNPDFK